VPLSLSSRFDVCVFVLQLICVLVCRESLFDVNIVNGKKPKFFSHPEAHSFRGNLPRHASISPVFLTPLRRCALHSVGDRKQPYIEGPVVTAPQMIAEYKARSRTVYTHGNWRTLNQVFAAISGKALSPANGPDATGALGSPDTLRVLYFGDNLKTDVMALRLYSDWYAGAIVEELHETWSDCHAVHTLK
jgi:hypothetical protein